MKRKQKTAQQNRYLFRKKFRISVMVQNECGDWPFRLLAEDANTSVQHIKKRYAKFLKRFLGIDKVDQILPSIWKDFVEYENGGEQFNYLTSFKEPLYPNV